MSPRELLSTPLSSAKAKLRLLGVTGKPTFQHTFSSAGPFLSTKSATQRFKDSMNNAEANAPGLFLAGNYRDGVSLSDSIVSGCNAAERIESFFAGRASLTRARLVAHEGGAAGAVPAFRSQWSRVLCGILV
jgi:hypothetical protein